MFALTESYDEMRAEMPTRRPMAASTMTATATHARTTAIDRCTRLGCWPDTHRWIGPMRVMSPATLFVPSRMSRPTSRSSVLMRTVMTMRVTVPGSVEGMSRAVCCSPCHETATGVKPKATSQAIAGMPKRRRRGACQRPSGGILRRAHHAVVPTA